jgi:hypothetical protein
VLRDAKTGELAVNPVTGQTIRLGSEFQAEREALEKQFPELPWAELVNDFREFNDVAAVEQSPPIAATVDALRDDPVRGGERKFMITARTSAPVLAALGEVARRQGLELDQVFSAKDPAVTDALSLGDAKLDTAARKALMIAALIEVYRPKHAEIDHVTFYDDTDGNLARAKELLPQLFPKTRFDFIDVVRQSDGSFTHVPR